MFLGQLVEFALNFCLTSALFDSQLSVVVEIFIELRHACGECTFRGNVSEYKRPNRASVQLSNSAAIHSEKVTG